MANLTYRCNNILCKNEWEVRNKYCTTTCPVCGELYATELIACAYCGKLNPIDEPCEEFGTDDGESILCGDPDAIKAQLAKELRA